MKFSLILRRIHLLAALFLMPWFLMYAVSTILANYTELFRSGEDTFQTESARLIPIPSDMRVQDAAKRILETLKIEESFEAQRQRDTGRIVIHTKGVFEQRRITYIPEEGKAVVEHRSLDFPTFVMGLHHRSGFHGPRAGGYGWGFSVDLVILSISFLSFSGLWMFWEIRSARRWGILCLIAGFSLFTFFLFAI